MSCAGHVRAAIDSARTVATGQVAAMYGHEIHSYDNVRAIVLAVAGELPHDMTIGQLVDELHIAENQMEEKT